MNASCRCVGSFCNCQGTAILKDGERFSVRVVMKDEAGPGQHVPTADAIMSDSDRAYAEMKARDAAAWSGGVPSRITPDLIADKGPEYARGLYDGAYEAMKARDAEGWRGAA